MTSSPPDVVVLDDVCRVYTMGEVEVEAVCEVTLSLPAGEFVVFLGPSGSGKTTLLNLIGGLDTPTRGRVIVQGRDLAQLDDAQLTAYRRRTVGFIFQFFNLIPTLTARENVELVAELVGHQEMAEWALAQVDLLERADHFPAELSGGEQQRVAIARAIVKQPALTLADEPTGNLDFETGLRVLRSLYELTRLQHQTVLTVTHNSVIARMADRVVRLRSGRVSEVIPVESPEPPEALVW